MTNHINLRNSLAVLLCTSFLSTPLCAVNSPELRDEDDDKVTSIQHIPVPPTKKIQFTPPEVLHNVFSYSSARGLGTASSVCTVFENRTGAKAFWYNLFNVDKRTKYGRKPIEDLKDVKSWKSYYKLVHILQKAILKGLKSPEEDFPTFQALISQTFKKGPLTVLYNGMLYEAQGKKAKAFKFYEAAAKKKNPLAQRWVNFDIRYGHKGQEEAKTKQERFVYLLRRALLGDKDALSHVSKVIYYDELGQKLDEQEKFNLFSENAKEGDEFAREQVQRLTGQWQAEEHTLEIKVNDEVESKRKLKEVTKRMGEYKDGAGTDSLYAMLELAKEGNDWAQYHVNSSIEHSLHRKHELITNHKKGFNYLLKRAQTGDQNAQERVLRILCYGKIGQKKDSDSMSRFYYYLRILNKLLGIEKNTYSLHDVIVGA